MAVMVRLMPGMLGDVFDDGLYCVTTAQYVREPDVLAALFAFVVSS